MMIIIIIIIIINSIYSLFTFQMISPFLESVPTLRTVNRVPGKPRRRQETRCARDSKTVF